ncbi:MAG: UDP-2,3-diacylglucosamine diphosphatase [Syntrophales bacterium]|nr:UDP-2,3-diacylglucosamine diphosphatase [Syntrophales bacterium]
MKAVFLSDAHLWNNRDIGYRKLISFFEEITGTVTHLVVAGDLFDFWFCDENNIYPEFREMYKVLLELKRRGTDIHLIEGNHDFFMDQAFNGHGIRIYPNEALIELGGKKIYVSHGDTIDRSNRRYLLLRRFLRSNLFYSLQKKMPSVLLWTIAGMTSNSSRKYQNRPEGIVSVMKRFAREKISDGIDAVILGHSHRPHLEECRSGGRAGAFVLLGDWVTHFSYLTLIDGNFSLEFYRGNGRYD